MFKSKKDQLLKLLYVYQVEQQRSFVQESLLLEAFGIDYKQLHRLALECQVEGLLQQFMERGGQAEYKLTEAGIQQAQQFQSKLRVWVILAALVCVAFVGYYIFN